MVSSRDIIRVQGQLPTLTRTGLEELLLSISYTEQLFAAGANINVVEAFLSLSSELKVAFWDDFETVGPAFWGEFNAIPDGGGVGAWERLHSVGAMSLKADVFWLSKFNGWITDGVSQAKINKIASELETGTPLTSSLSTEPFSTSTLKEGFESGIINFTAWEKINDGIPSLQNNTSKYYHYLRRMSRYADEVDNGGVVKYYRVQTQHPGSHILAVDANNNLIFNDPSRALNLSTDTRSHANYYFDEKLMNGDTPYIIEFEVPKSLDVDIKRSAIPQDGATSNIFNDDGLLPKIGDPNQPGDPFELTSLYHNLISFEYITGSAKIVPR